MLTVLRTLASRRSVDSVIGLLGFVKLTGTCCIYFGACQFHKKINTLNAVQFITLA